MRRREATHHIDVVNAVPWVRSPANVLEYTRRRRCAAASTAQARTPLVVSEDQLTGVHRRVPYQRARPRAVGPERSQPLVVQARLAQRERIREMRHERRQTEQAAKAGDLDLGKVAQCAEQIRVDTALRHVALPQASVEGLQDVGTHVTNTELRRFVALLLVQGHMNWRAVVVGGGCARGDQRFGEALLHRPLRLVTARNQHCLPPLTVN
jgi:hypothetical protein